MGCRIHLERRLERRVWCDVEILVRGKDVGHVQGIIPRRRRSCRPDPFFVLRPISVTRSHNVTRVPSVTERPTPSHLSLPAVHVPPSCPRHSLAASTTQSTQTRPRTPWQPFATTTTMATATPPPSFPPSPHASPPMAPPRSLPPCTIIPAESYSTRRSRWASSS